MKNNDIPSVQAFNDGASLSLVDVLDHPSLFDPITHDYASELRILQGSWSSRTDWPYHRYVFRAYKLIYKEYEGKQDKSGAPLFHHPMNVASDSYRMARLFGFDQMDATTVWIAGLCHDYIEDAKDHKTRLLRQNKIGTLFNDHDPDVLNLVLMLSNFDKGQTYFQYVEKIGSKSGFTDQSTVKAQIAALILKYRDCGHNARPDRNRYILERQAQAEFQMQAGGPQEAINNARETLDWVKKKQTKIKMYDMVMALMVSKLKGLIGAEDGLPIDATMIDFLLTPDGIPYRISDYHDARVIGLGEQGVQILKDRISKDDLHNGHVLVISNRSVGLEAGSLNMAA